MWRWSFVVPSYAFCRLHLGVFYVVGCLKAELESLCLWEFSLRSLYPILILQGLSLYSLIRRFVLNTLNRSMYESSCRGKRFPFRWPWLVIRQEIYPPFPTGCLRLFHPMIGSQWLTLDLLIYLFYQTLTSFCTWFVFDLYISKPV